MHVASWLKPAQSMDGFALMLPVAVVVVVVVVVDPLGMLLDLQ
jgi:hypothetical protein